MLLPPTKKIIQEWETRSNLNAVIVKIIIDRWPISSYYCGYVGITNTHPLYGATRSEPCKCLVPFLNKKKPSAGELSLESFFIVHGGITFSAFDTIDYPVKSDLHWVGFDCAHGGDTIETCDLNYCQNECENLAEQLKDVGDVSFSLLTN